MATTKYQTQEGHLRHMLLVELLPFVGMLFLVSWLTLWAVQRIDQRRDHRLAVTEVSSLQHF